MMFIAGAYLQFRWLEDKKYCFLFSAEWNTRLRWKEEDTFGPTTAAATDTRYVFIT